MSERRVTASEMRKKFADYLSSVNACGRRVLITTHGRDRAYLIGIRELRALEESLEKAREECGGLLGDCTDGS